MLGKRSRPLIMKLSGSSFQPPPSDTVNIATTSTAITSPRSPLDFQIPVSKTMTGSPAVKNNFNDGNIIKCSYDRVGFSVGLGLIIALEESNYDGAGGEKILVNYGIRNSSTPRSVPIPVNLSRRSRYAGRGGDGYFKGENNDLYYNRGKLEEENDEEEEDYTLVIRRGGAEDKTVNTRVYCDNDKDCRGKHQSGNDYSRNCRNDCTVATTMSRSRQKQDGGASAVFKISSGFCGDEEEVDSRTNCSDFLSNCHMCRKTLIGKDIYMYRGEKAFCSEECRQRQIASDERKEKKFCRSEAAVAMAAASTSFRSSSSPSNSRTPYHYEAMFTAGMVAV